MSSQIVSKTMRPDHRDIYVVIMDDYGVPMHISLPVSLSKADRDVKVAAAIATMDTGQAMMEAQAVAESLDLTSLKTTGGVKRAAALKASGYIAEPASAATTAATTTSATK